MTAGRRSGERWLRVAIMPWALAALVALAAPPTAEEIEFFEQRVRPVLVDSCYSCHSAKAEKLKGGLRLDTRDSLLKGGDSGAVIVPGHPDASRLIQAVRYQDPELQMPPKGQRLTPEKIADLEAWVKMGAPDPRTGGAGTPALAEVAAARARHWAFQPVSKPPLPAVRNARWVKTPVDAFVLAKLEANGLKPAPRADRRTLIRRVSYDLTGLPPRPEEVEEFVMDAAPDAYSRLVDRLLASPHYGERWGRFWLDVARYADTKGYLAGGEERRFSFSHTYRDYVIRAFNEDRPYQQFLIEQIAADRLPLGEDKSALAALGFLTLGRRFLNNQNDIIDDRLDVVIRGTQALTLGCARCHDHKFDPISMRDYYGLHGVFASSEEPSEKPLLRPLDHTPAYEGYLQEIARLEGEIEAFKEKECAGFLGELRQHAGEYLLGARQAANLKEQGNFDTFAGERKLNPVILRRWMADLEGRRQKADPIFTAWFELAALPEKEFGALAPALAARLATNAPTLNPLVATGLAAISLESLSSVAELYTRLFKETESAWRAALDTAEKEHRPLPSALPDPEREALRQVLYAEGAPVNLPKAELRQLLARRLGEGTAPLRNKIEELNWTHPGAPLRAMALVDKPQPRNSPIFLRGNPATPGPETPRRFLDVLAKASPQPFTNGSGRLELAQAIASPENPLTARVYVNRVWLHHFGQGLVSTPGDFGVRTEPPFHRDLLDYLAARFMEEGWSTKKLHRLILLSAVFQQSSTAQTRNLAADPDNRCLHHFSRRRLEFEALRDTFLAVSGRLDGSVGGLPVDLLREPFAPRRTVYGFIDRQNLPGIFRTFDFANPDTSSSQRFHTTVPQQALFLMNSPFAVRQARALVCRDEVTRATDDTGKIQSLHRLIFQRAAAREEIRLARKFIASQPPHPSVPKPTTGVPTAPPTAPPSDPKNAAAPLDPWERYAQVLLLSNELMFVD